MITTRGFVVMIVLAVAVGSIAGIALGAAYTMAAERVRAMLEPIDWEGVDE